MLHLAVVLPLSLFIWFCSVAILSMAIASGSLALLNMVVSFTKGWDHALGGIIGAVVWGMFSFIVALGAFHLGSSVVDGLILRLS